MSNALLNMVITNIGVGYKHSLFVAKDTSGNSKIFATGNNEYVELD
jgi:hypothetical protein